MKKNMGSTDRWIRAIVGIAIGIAGIYFQSWWGLIAIVPLGTAIIGWCPVYAPFRLSTKKGDQG